MFLLSIIFRANIISNEQILWFKKSGRKNRIFKRALTYLIDILKFSIIFKAAQCQMTVTARQECGYMGIKQPERESKGCCWKPLQKGSKAPGCYKPGKRTKNR